MSSFCVHRYWLGRYFGSWSYFFLAVGFLLFSTRLIGRMEELSKSHTWDKIRSDDRNEAGRPKRHGLHTTDIPAHSSLILKIFTSKDRYVGSNVYILYYKKNNNTFLPLSPKKIFVDSQRAFTVCTGLDSRFCCLHARILYQRSCSLSCSSRAPLLNQIRAMTALYRTSL